MKNIITEELGYMKYLFGYQRGVVISEQSNKTGCIKGNCENGIGTYKWPSGNVYEGQWKDGVQNGAGASKWSSGNVYKGQYKDGYINGVGTYKWSDGTIYTGQWKDSEMNGQGTYTNLNGVESKGIWVDDKLNGKTTEDLDKLTQSNQTKPESTNKANWEDVVKYYEGNKDPNWKFDKKGKEEYDGVMFEFVKATSKDTNDSDLYMKIYDDGEVYFWNKGRGTGRSRGTWEWENNKPKINFKDISKNASGYVQPTDTDWKAVTEDNKVIGLNAKGPLVKDVQQSLIKIGYSGNTGKPITKDIQGCLDDIEKCDGIYGKSTKEMVKQFQKDNGLAVDGVVGKQTYFAFYDL
jgi:hypothetical protein